MASSQDSPPIRPKSAAALRRFRLRDAMILIAAAAIGFATTHAILRVLDTDWPEIRRSFPLDEPGSWFFLSFLAVPTLLASSLALIPIRLIRPRPRRWASQPGMMAVFAVAMNVGMLATYATVSFLMGGLDRLLEGVGGLFLFVPLSPLLLFPIAILSSWLTLLISRRWKPEPGWIDRTGRAIGCLWILWGILSLVTYLYAISHTMVVPAPVYSSATVAAPASVSEPAPAPTTKAATP